MKLLIELIMQPNKYNSLLNAVWQYLVLVWIAGGLMAGLITSWTVKSRSEDIICDILWEW